MNIVDLKAGTVLARVVKLSGSRRRRAIIAPPATEVKLSGTYWDEGSRCDYYLVNMDSWTVMPLAHWAPPHFGGPVKDPVINLHAHLAVVEAGTCCGKPSTPTVYFHTDHKM